jgi:hypothetical protein
LVLCVLVAIVGRSNTDFDFPRMFFIALGVGLFAAALNAFVPGAPGVVAIVAACGLLAYLLMHCGLTLQQALIVTGLYVAYQIGFALLITSLLSSARA